MPFRKKSLQYEPFADYYLDYDKLHNAILSAPPQQQQTLPPPPPSPQMTPDATALASPRPHREAVSLEFLSLLHRQVETICLFVIQEQGKIAAEIQQCHQVEKHLPSDSSIHASSSPFMDSKLSDIFVQAGLHLLRLIQYVDWNVTNLQDLLKKHDQVRHTRLYLAFLGKPHAAYPLLQPLLQPASLDALVHLFETALISVYDFNRSADMEDPQQWKNPAGGMMEAVSPSPLSNGSRQQQQQRRRRRRTMPTPYYKRAFVRTPRRHHHERTTSAPNSEMAQLAQQALLQENRKAQTPATWERKTSSDGLSTKRRKSPFVILLQIQAARRRLKQTGEFVQLLAAPMMMSDDEESTTATLDEDDDETVASFMAHQEGRSSHRSNVLNLASTFLYMTNYYIVAPTSGSYAERLGGTASLSGIIIGMTPIAALVSTLLYSWWTSHSYKGALLFASACSIVGNLFYALGLPMNSMLCVLIGRLWNGFGSARAINRRYIADRFSHRERTAASAAFVTAGALGMAAGPALASGLHLTTSSSSSLYWQNENAVGWFMFGLWSLYAILLWLWFENPKITQKATQHEVPTEKRVELTKTTERTSLLEKGEKLSNGFLVPDGGDHRPLWKNIPVMVTFAVYFVLKLVLECILSSSPTLVRFYFGWDGAIAGVYLAGLGLLMLPANLLVAYLARHSYADRELIVAFEWAMLVGCVAVLHYGSADPSSYALPQYILGSFLVFVSTNALEGPNMSLLSKTIPRSWSRGFFNVGLLATEAGTLGRAVGDLFLTACAANGTEHILNYSFGTMSLLSLGCVMVTYANYDCMVVPSDKEE